MICRWTKTKTKITTITITITTPLTRGSEKKAVLGDGDNPKGQTTEQPNLKIDNTNNNNNKTIKLIKN